MKTLVKCFALIDKKILYFINTNIKCRFLDKIMPLITELGGAIFTTGFVLMLISFGKSKLRLIGLEALIGLSASQLIVQILKKSLSRERPYNILNNINTFNIKLKDYSFPSGHTTASFSIAVSLSINLPYLSVILIATAFTVGISRIYLGVHYPSDVLVGIFLGSITPIAIHPYFLSFIA